MAKQTRLVKLHGKTRRLPGNLLSLEQLHQLYEQYNIQLHVPVVKSIQEILIKYSQLLNEQ